MDKKKLVIGVIGADVHAVGISILQHAFEDAGFEVTNLGVMVSQEEYISAAIETGADGIMVSSLYGHGELDCRGLREKCDEAGLKGILLYVGGNIVVGKQPFDEVEKRFKAMGFDRVFGPGTAPETTIAALYEDFGIEADVTSDCAPLWNTVEAVMNTTHNLHVIRDATRGGVGTVLYEIAGQSNVGIRLDAAAVPVAPEVKGVCGMLGLEPLYLACEGRMVIMAPKSEAEKIVETLRQCPYSKDAAIIGEVTADQPGKVVMTTEIGTQALLPQPGGELLPRIC